MHKLSEMSLSHRRAQVAETFRFDPHLALEKYDPAETLGFTDKAETQVKLASDITSMIKLQEMLVAQKHYGILIVLQGMDSAGKDSAIKHVMNGVNQQGVSVHSFQVPTVEESRHDYLWRCARVLPERGRIVIFNRSHYEDVLVTRVHPEMLGDFQERALEQGDRFWNKRYRDINRFESYLARNRIITIKFFLHISIDEQRSRLEARLNDPTKQWKFSAADLTQRASWTEYAHAYEQMLQATSTKNAPWYVIPADRKWFTHLAIADIVVDRMQALDLAYPQLSDETRATIEQQRLRIRS